MVIIKKGNFVSHTIIELVWIWTVAEFCGSGVFLLSSQEMHHSFCMVQNSLLVIYLED